MVEILLSSNACAISVSLTSEDKRQQHALDAEADAAREAGVHYLDLRADICPDGVCQTRRGGLWIYRDGAHISEGFSVQLAPILARAVTSPSAVDDW